LPAIGWFIGNGIRVVIALFLSQSVNKNSLFFYEIGQAVMFDAQFMYPEWTVIAEPTLAQVGLHIHIPRCIFKSQINIVF
jgi:hypothetical protein